MSGERRLEILLLVLLCALAFYSTFTPVWDPDSFWHLAFGKYMYGSGSLPRTEPFAFTREGSGLYDLSWLPQLFFYLVYRAAGTLGLKTVVSLLALGSMALVCLAVKAAKGDLLSLGLFFGLFYQVFAGRFRLRPEGVSLLCFSVLVYLLTLYRGGRDLPRPVFPLLFLFWAQVHPSWIYGFIIIPLFILERRRPSQREGLPGDLFWMLALPCAALFVNPYGYKPVIFPITSFFEMKGESSFYIEEWAHFPWTARTAPYIAAMGILVAVYTWRLAREKRGLFPLLHVAIQVFLTLYWIRYRSFGMIALAPLAIPCIDGITVRLERFRTAAAVLVVLLLLTGMVSVYHDVARDEELVNCYPLKEADFLLENDIDGNALHSYAAGGFLEFKAAPRIKVFFDGRYFEFAKLYREFSNVGMTAESFGGFLKKYPFDIIVLPYSDMMVHDPATGMRKNIYSLIIPRNEWAPVFYGPYGFVFLKRGPHYAGTISKYEYRFLLPYDREWVKLNAAGSEENKRSLEDEIKRAWGTGAKFLREKKDD